MIESREKSHIFTAKNVDHAIGVVHQAVLSAQVCVGVSQAVFNECVVETTNPIESDTGSQVRDTIETWRIFVELDLLFGVAFGINVGNIVRDRAQRPLIGVDC